MALAVAVGTGDDAGAEAGVVSRSSGVRSGVDTRRDPSEACADRSGADELRGMLGCCCCACPGAPYTSMSDCTFQAKPPGVDASCEATSEAHAAVASYSALDDSAAPPVAVPQATAPSEGPMSVAIMSLSAACPSCLPAANAAADDDGGAVTASVAIPAADASAFPCVRKAAAVCGRRSPPAGGLKAPASPFMPRLWRSGGCDPARE